MTWHAYNRSCRSVPLLERSMCPCEQGSVCASRAEGWLLFLLARFTIIKACNVQGRPPTARYCTIRISMLLSFTDTFFRNRLSNSQNHHLGTVHAVYRYCTGKPIHRQSFHFDTEDTGPAPVCPVCPVCVPAPPGVFLPAYGTGTHHRCANSHARPVRRRWMTCRPRLCLRLTQTSSNGPEWPKSSLLSLALALQSW